MKGRRRGEAEEQAVLPNLPPHVQRAAEDTQVGRCRQDVLQGGTESCRRGNRTQT